MKKINWSTKGLQQLRKKNTLMLSISYIRSNFRFHNGNGHFPDHENNKCKFMLFFYHFKNFWK